MQPWLIAQMLILLALANGTPVFASKIFGERFSWPIDGGLRFFERDGIENRLGHTQLVTTAGLCERKP